MSIATQITALQQDKSDIAAAITNKGGTVNSGDGFDDFANDIMTIPSGGGTTITATNNTGSTVNSGDRVFVTDNSNNIVKDIAEYATTWLDNFDVHGNNMTTDDLTGIASGFDSTSYLTRKTPFNPGNNTWEIARKIHTGSNVTTLQGIFHSKQAGTLDSTRYGIVIQLSVTSNFILNISSDGTTWNTQTGTYTILPDTDYWIKASYDGTTYKLFYSLDGVTYVEDISFTGNPVNYTLAETFEGYFWRQNGNSPFFGSIDYSEGYTLIGNTNSPNCLITEAVQLGQYEFPTHYSGYYNISSNGILRSNIPPSSWSNNYWYSYADITKDFNPGSSNWSFQVHVITPNATDMAEGSNIVSSSNKGAIYQGGFSIELNNQGLLGFGVSSNGSSWNLGWAYGSTALQPDTNYLIRLSFDGTKYLLEYSEDFGSTWTENCRITSSTPIYHYTTDPSLHLRLGNWYTSNGTKAYRWRGSIFLADTVIKIADKIWFKGGSLIGNQLLISEGGQSGIAQENIATGQSGAVKVMV